MHRPQINNHRFRRQLSRCVILGGLVCALLSSIGCQSGLLSRFGPPGTMDYQRSRAMLHDPFPSNEIAPEIYSSRPLGFQRPRAETTQLQTSPTARKGGQYVPGGF